MLITGRPHGLKLSGQHLLAFNNAIELAGKHLPTEFNRIPRKADALKKWKATEFRTFSLYIGPIVFHFMGTIGRKINNLFLLYHVAMIILSHEDLYFVNLDYAEKILRLFVKKKNPKPSLFTMYTI